MNNRQKKKLYKQTLIKVRKLHPQRGDVICLQFDPDKLYFDTICEFMKGYSNNEIFGEANIVVVPTNIKQLDKETIQVFINELQSAVDDMGE